MERNILVTGVSRGLGLEISKTLLNLGHNVYGLSRSITNEVAQFKKDYVNQFNFLEFDLANSEMIQKKIIKEWITNKVALSGVVNNAAIAYDDIVSNLDLNRLRNLFEVNVFSSMLITKYAIRNMILHRSGGSLVHISSISVHTGYKGLAMYAASKGALEAFSRNTAREWGKKGIRSNCLVAGFMETEMSSTLSGDQKERIYSRTCQKSPTTTKSVSDTVAFLLSDRAESITGQNIHVDSGTI
tara:strand:+ start:281 stop:1009 length:729 start_codon:yes stop_codon:yes gene_type:complete